MKKVFLTIIFTIVFLSLGNFSLVFAIENPLISPNNKLGIHILFPSELKAAANLINSSGGDWGYVTIPIQANDKDQVKWQTFMDDCKNYHIIPLIRLATIQDQTDGRNWKKPVDTDITSFANFLNSLSWPVKNRYIIIFNEVNRGDEWDGISNPAEYANILKYSVSIFKSKNPNFFIISAGMDNDAENNATNIDEYSFMEQMNTAVPGIFNQVDGLASHSYPNPGFNQPPSVNTNTSITSFIFEKNLAEKLSIKTFPIFITETGWSKKSLSIDTIASYMTQAFNTVWQDSSIVAITPFLFFAGSAPFNQFSFVNQDESSTNAYLALKDLPKTKGSPILEVIPTITSTPSANLALKNNILGTETKRESNSFISFVQNFMNHLFNLL